MATVLEQAGEDFPRISLVSQCYVEYLTQPILILRQDSDIAFLRYAVEQKGVGLMFTDQEQQAFNFLLADSQILMSFFGIGMTRLTLLAIHQNYC